VLDDVWQEADFGVARNGEPCAEVVPEGDAELGAGLAEAEEGVAAIAADIAAGSAADFSPCDLAADIVFRSVGASRRAPGGIRCARARARAGGGLVCGGFNLTVGRAYIDGRADAFKAMIAA